MTTIPDRLPLDSEKFLPPASCKHKTKDEAILKEENPDRERMVCAIGLDVHYELNVVANETGAYEPRLKPFNPRMSGPACPPNYTGKFLSEEEYLKHSSDPISLGRAIDKVAPYDRDLYLKRDPRLVSKTVIVRDYGCKIPIELADTEKIARAVLNHYPDQYVAFLGEFVSNIFGATMRQFLEKQKVGLQKLIAQPEELNRISWGAYMAVQGGVDMNATPPPNLAGPALDEWKDRALQGDCTLRWTDDIAAALGNLTKDGRAMTGQCTSEDVYNLRPCLQKHIETLDRMITTFCRGFGSKEMHVLAMLWYANGQGHKLCHDLQLMSESDTPSYEKLTMHVPINLYHTSDSEPNYTHTLEPELNSSIKATLHEERRPVKWTPTVLYPVGNWSGNADAVNVFLKTASPSPFQWGWGHAANVSMRWSGDRLNDANPGSLTNPNPPNPARCLVAPHLRYSFNTRTCSLSIDSNVDVGREFVKETRWGEAYMNPAPGNPNLLKTIPPAEKMKKRTLRESLDDVPSTHAFRGSSDFKSEADYRAVNETNVDRNILVAKEPKSPKEPKSVTAPKIPPSTKCLNDNEFAVVHPDFHELYCESMEPFLSTGGRCIEVSDSIAKFPWNAVGPFDMGSIRRLGIFKDFMGSAQNPVITCGNATGRYASAFALFQQVKDLATDYWKTYLSQLPTSVVVGMAAPSPRVVPAGGDPAAVINFDDTIQKLIPDMATLVNRSIDPNIYDLDFSRNGTRSFDQLIDDNGITLEDIKLCLEPAAYRTIVRATIGRRRLVAATMVAEAHFARSYSSLSAASPNIPMFQSQRVAGYTIGGTTTIPQMVKMLIRNMVMEWWEKNDSRGNSECSIMSLIEHSSFHLIVRMSKPTKRGIDYIPQILPTYQKVGLGDSWKVRTIFRGPNTRKQVLLPFLNQVDTFSEWKKCLPTNMLDMSRFPIKNEAVVDFASRDIGSGDNLTDPIAAQLVTMRLVIQSSMGMFIGALLCDNVFNQNNLLFPDLVSTISYRSQGNTIAGDWNAIWPRIDPKHGFEWDSQTRTLKMIPAGRTGEFLSMEAATNAIMRSARDAIFERVKTMMGTDSAAKRNLIQRLENDINLRYPNPNPTISSNNTNGGNRVTRLIESLGMQNVATDLIMQSGADLDPLFLYAGTYTAYKDQWKRLPKDCDVFVPNVTQATRTKWEEWIISEFDTHKLALVQLREAYPDKEKYRGVNLNAGGWHDLMQRQRQGEPVDTNGCTQEAREDADLLDTQYDYLSVHHLDITATNQAGTSYYYPTVGTTAVKPSDPLGRFVRGPIKAHDPLDPNNGGEPKHVTILPVTRADYQIFKKDSSLQHVTYNYNMFRPQFFSVIDAAALLWHAREFVNAADSNRPKHYETGQTSDMHPWCIGLCETFMYARETFLTKHDDELWEAEVKKNPQKAFPPSFIGKMCEESWKRYFPLLPTNHPLREELSKIRALDYIWGTLPAYSSGTSFASNDSGAWMPLSMAHQVRLLDSVGLFDHKYHVPSNPWLAHNGQGISRVFNQSYHSVYHTDSYRAPHFRQWLKEACRYQSPDKGCFYPFSQYGGTPVMADFVPHRVEKPDEQYKERHKQLMYNRFGFHTPLRLGQQFHDTGLLQDMYSFKYRQYADLSAEQRAMKDAEAVYPSNFLAYARNHAIIALASCNQGTEEPSVPRIVRNLYRLYVDTYECMGANPDDDGVPCIMGFLPSAIRGKEDRPVILYAGSLACLNTKLERFCNSPANKGERVCQIYKQVYLNDATLLFTRLLRAERRKLLHKNNYSRALNKRHGNYTQEQFNNDLIELQDAYIEFLQTTIIGMLLENGADLNNAPLHLLEPRELEVSMLEEDDNVVGNDYLTPRTSEILKGMDFNGDNLTRSQLAILSLIPPNHRILGTLRLNQNTEIIDLEHAKKQIQRETIASNKKVWQRYSEALIGAAFGQKLLEVDGPIDFGYDMSAIKDPMGMRFNMSDIKDPLKESEGIATKLSTSAAQASSSLSQTIRGESLRNERGPESVLGMNSADLAKALQAVRDRVDRDYTKNGGTVPKIKCLALLKIPEHIKRMLRPQYE